MSTDNTENFSYKAAGVDIDEKNKTFEKINKFVSQPNKRVLNTMGAFASLIDINFAGEYKEPVLTFKLEEPGTKQKLGWENNSLHSVAHDMINHLVNDIIVMGSKPVAVQDLIVCGNLKDEVITPLIKAMKEACDNNNCSLVGGETSEQPGVVSAETHILGASIIGVVERSKIIDGQKIKAGHKVLGFGANGLHTNGYSLARKILDTMPETKEMMIEGKSFIDHLLIPHPTYYPMLADVLEEEIFTGLAHITGGGIAGNLSRVIPDGLTATVDLEKVGILPIFKFIKEQTGNTDADMLQTFNMGVGLVAIVEEKDVAQIMALATEEVPIVELGEIEASAGDKVTFLNELKW